MSLAARAAAVALVVLAVGGGVWLIVSWSSAGPMAPLTAAPTDAADLAALRQALSARDIIHRIENGQLYVPTKSLATAREILSERATSVSAAMAELRKLTEADDIWSSQAQRDRRWQVATMALLSAQISSLPDVQSATVILSPPVKGRFGRPSQVGGASVKLTARSDGPADEALYETIADMVCGGVSGIRRQDVCIVDGRGRSYHAAPAAPADGVTARTRQAEAYYAARIRRALSFIDGAVVTARAVVDPKVTDQIGRCIGASVSLPRSDLRAAYRAHGGEQSLDVFTASRESAIIETVMRETQITDARAVAVGWHDAAPVGRGRSPGRQDGPNAETAGSTKPLGLALGATVILLGAALLWRRSAASSVGRKARRVRTELVAPAPIAAPDRSGGPFAFLLKIPDQELLTLLKGEHPQTTALVLAHLGPGKAAAVLAGLEPARQVDVVRRVATLGTPAGEVAGEIARGLAARLGKSAMVEAEPGGLSTAAEILQHAGYDAEQTVLDGLSDDEPVLADSIRRHMFIFEDIASLPAETVGKALGPLACDDIAVALRTAGDEIRDKVLMGLDDAAGPVRDAMERIGPVRLSDVEAAQQRVAMAVRQVYGEMYVSEDQANVQDNTIRAGQGR